METVQQPTFREQLGILEKDGKRHWIYPKKVSGKYYKWRSVVAAILLLFLFVAPFVKINNYPLVLLNIFERRFALLGFVFHPQDLFLFALAMITAVVCIALFTVVLGRIFCGWICPQTIFLEMVFRTIERWIEGDANQQKKLDEQPWNSEKVIKKSLKHLVFFAFSFLVAHTFLAYLIGIDQLWTMLRQTPLQHPVAFVSLLIFTGLFYAVFAHLRELVCIVVCPYGRLQGVLLDKNSLVVAYDYVRGEPRGKIFKSQSQHRENVSKGDCIDCKLCVQVCPTGIDIRNGTQLECINCTACIDACDEVMQKIGRPTGLIGYYTAHQIEDKTFRREDNTIKPVLPITTRTIAYFSVLIILIGIMTTLLVTRKDVEITVLRMPGTLYQKLDNGVIANLYQLEVVNKTPYPKTIQVKGVDSQVIVVGTENNLLKLSEGEVEKFTIMIQMHSNQINSYKMKTSLQFLEGKQVISEKTTNFIAPYRYKSL
ncbi:MAG: cytochrome c oxidase accessory protein CcoG [Cytophagales bacterium]|nr:cytochrome c oxidase accessory protein CcoG [Cytophagales bacterium]MDW8384726.1 cytochrome c oxidase accessory protein CcoG [Flammeovirgaceae bacterium]